MKLTKEMLTEMVKEVMEEAKVSQSLFKKSSASLFPKVKQPDLDPQPEGFEDTIRNLAEFDPKMIAKLRTHNVNLTGLDSYELDSAIDNMQMIIHLLENLIEARKGNGW